MQVKNTYSFFYKMKLVYWFIRTKLIAPKARLIRFPFDIRGRKFIDLGENLTTGIGCRIEAFSSDRTVVLSFGKNIQINDYVHISAMKNVIIGNNVLMAGHVYISDNSHGCYKGSINDSSPKIPPVNRKYLTADVWIKDNVWIGEHVVILPGVIIGEGVIIGANSVVTKDVAPYTMVVGQPAKPIKIFNFEFACWQRI